ncbi:threonine/serine exporter family protein [Arcanobacterium hippocoleae]
MNEKEVETIAENRETLREKSQVLLLLGTMLLNCGAGAYRVKSAMARAAKALGLTKHESHVSLYAITTMSWQNKESCAGFAEQHFIGVNSEKLDRVANLVSTLGEKVTASDLRSRLQNISKHDWHYGLWKTVFASAIACAGFCFLNNGRIIECALVFLAAGFGQLVRKLLLQRHAAHFLIWVICGVVSTILYVAGLAIIVHTGLGEAGMHEYGIISSVLYLIPGFPLTTAMLDFVRGDFQSAINRFAYCFMVLGSAGLAIWFVAHIFAWNVNEIASDPLSTPVLYGLRILTSFVAAYGFAVLFNATWKVCLAAATVGAFANTGRLFLQEFANVPWQIAVGIAAFVIGVIATTIAWRTAHSRVSLSVPAVVIMIPGVPFYRGLVAMNEGAINFALQNISEVIFVVLAIGMGLAFSRVLLDDGWRKDMDTSKLPEKLEITRSDNV